MSVLTASIGSAVGFAPTGTGRERTPWHAVQSAAWEALTTGRLERVNRLRSRLLRPPLSCPDLEAPEPFPNQHQILRATNNAT